VPPTTPASAARTCSQEKDAISRRLIDEYEAAAAARRESSLARRSPTQPLPRSAASTHSIAASLLAPPAPPVTEEQLRELAPGISSEEVVERLGEPYMRITADYERLTYRVTTGKI
jgi:hypothetical protein